jgi:competence protein ComEC
MPPKIPAWKEAPFVRLLIPLAAGIIIQWYIQVKLLWLVTGLSACVLLVCIFSVLALKDKFRLHYLNGISINLLLAFLGALMVFINDTRNESNWIGHARHPACLLITLEEPLQEKPNSYKAIGIIQGVKYNKWETSKGKVILYFQKAPGIGSLRFGSQILVKNRLQEIKIQVTLGALIINSIVYSRA